MDDYKKINFEVVAYKDNDTGKYQGVVLSGGDPLLYGEQRRTEEQAIMTAYRQFFRALGCNHRFKFDTSGEPYPIDQDLAGNEIYGYITTCELCGLVDTYEYTERDRDDYYHL